MPSNHTGDPSVFNATVSFPTDGDPKKITPIRSALNVLLDNDAYLRAERTRVALAMLLRAREIEDSASDASEICGATCRGTGRLLIVAKAGDAWRFTDWDRNLGATTTDISNSAAHDAANNGTRILVVGAGGNRCAYSDDDGSSWTAGGDIGATAKRVVWDATESKFICTSSTSSVSRSTDGTSWTTNGSANVDPDGGLAVLSNGDVVGCHASLAGTLRRSTDAGAAFSSDFGVSGSLDDNGSVAGNGGTYFYHVGRLSSGSSLKITRFTSVAPGSVIATISPPSGQTFASRPRILMCQNTGALVVAVPLSSSVLAVYGSLDGVTWVGPMITKPSSGISGVALAGGRLVLTYDASIYVSDGVGVLL